MADHAYCSFSDILLRRTVPTIDNPECVVNYCKRPAGAAASGM